MTLIKFNISSFFVILIITIALTGLVTKNIYCQNHDSLFSIWQDNNKSDSIRVQAYKDYIWKGILFSEPDSAIELTNALEEFSKQQNYPMGLVTAFYINAIANYLQGNYTDAFGYSQESLKIAEKNNFNEMLASNLNLFGLIYEKQGYFTKALDYHQHSLKIREELGDKRGIAASLNNIGEILDGQGNSSGALDYFERSLNITEELGDKRGMATGLMNIGICYFNQGYFDQVFNYYLRSLQYYEELGDKRGVIQCLNALGKAYFARKEISKALHYFNRSLEMSEDIAYKRGIVISLVEIGNTYLDKGDHTVALNYCKRSFELSKEIEALELQRNACQCIYKSYKIADNKGKALDYLEKLNEIKDSLDLQETAKTLLQMEFNIKMLQDSIARAEEERLVKKAYEEEVRQNKRTRNISIGSGLFFLLLAGGFYSRWNYVRKSKSIIEHEKERADRLLLNILPAEIAEELKEKGKADAREFENVAVLFTDFVDFTKTAHNLTAVELVEEINLCFEAFDEILEKFKIEKIKTIGDAYMAVGGLPVLTNNSIKNTVLAALEMQQFIMDRRIMKDAVEEKTFEMRVGIHSGPVVAGIVGSKKFQYDIWGDTVNTASRMENNGEGGKVNISQDIYNVIKKDPQFSFTSRGRISTKGKGNIEMYFVKKTD